MKTTISIAFLAAIGLVTAGCGESSSEPADQTTPASNAADDAVGDTHMHEDGTTHADHEEEAPAEDHAHDETPIGTVTIGDMAVELAQGHGAVAAGQEGHLVVKLPYNDGGATIVRAWIGTEDRTLSFVGRGEYAPDHDDYDIHAMAPTPLPENTMWWIEIEKPDGTKVVGSAQPAME